MSATVDAHSCLSLVALLTWRDLLFCAKHLFVAAMAAIVLANGASPFGMFTNTIFGTGCDNGGSNNGCGVHDLTFHITTYYGMFGNQWDSKSAEGILNVYFAADILRADCEGGCASNVGGGTVPVPGPIVGAGLRA